MAFAGLWDRWTDPASGDEVLSATIIVSGASEWMTPYHDRMPVLLGPEALKPAAEEALREWIVSSRVNRTGHGDDDPTIVEPVAAMGCENGTNLHHGIIGRPRAQRGEAPGGDGTSGGASRAQPSPGT